MIAAEIAVALGGARRSGRWQRCICPVHGSRTGRSLTLALLDGERGLIVHCHAGCSRDQILAELRRQRLISEDRHRAASFTGHCGHQERRVEIARRIWSAAREAFETPVVRYLSGRDITIPPPPALRWAPRCRHPSGIDLPAMVARVDGIDGELIGIQRTFLRPDGASKAAMGPMRAMLGRVVGGAVRLAPAAELLLIGEGIETCLAVAQACSLPAWAALSTSGMTSLALPTSVREVVILADNDVNGSGERAARTAAQRWLGEGKRVRIALPPEPGMDFADVLAWQGHARLQEVHDVAA
jgi:putative DNA primase/helicase